MSYTITQLLNFQSYYNSIKDTPLPLKIAYSLSKLSSRIIPEIKFHYTRLQEIAEECGERGEPDENGNAPLVRDEQGNIKIAEVFRDQCEKCLEELYNFSYEIEPLDLTIEDFPNTNITPNDLENLIPFLKQ